MNNEERRAKLKKSAQELNKKFGIGSIKTGDQLKAWDRASFGVPAFDEIIGGGIPYGNFTTIWGASASGKSTLACLLASQAQKEGKIVYYIALEQFDPQRASQLGINMDELIVGQFEKAEQSLDSIIKFSKEGLVDVIILDSIHSLSCSGEQADKKGDKSVEADTMALLARKLSQFFRMATDPVKKGNVAVLLIGQTRTSIGFIAMDQLTGGNALKHYCKLIIHCRRGKKSDAPVVPHKEYFKDEETGKERFKTVKDVSGFDCVLKIDKAQITGVHREGTEIHIPYYFESAFALPQSLKEEVEQEEKEIKEQENSQPSAKDPVPFDMVSYAKKYVKEQGTDPYPKDYDHKNAEKGWVEDHKKKNKIDEEKKSIKDSKLNITKESLELAVESSTAIEGVHIKVEPKKRGRGRPKGKKK